MLELGPRGSSHISCQNIQQSSHSTKLAAVACGASIACCGCRKQSARPIWTPAPHRVAGHDAAISRVPATSCCSVAASTSKRCSGIRVHLLAAVAQPGTGLRCNSGWGAQQKNFVTLHALPNAFPEGGGSNNSTEETAGMSLQQVQGQQQQQQQLATKHPLAHQQTSNAQAAAASSSKPGRPQQAGRQKQEAAKQSPQPRQQRAWRQRQPQQQAGTQIAQQEQAEQQPAAPPVYGRFRQQLKRLVQQQQAQLSEGPTSYAGLRAAASGSTALLLSLLNSQLTLLVGNSSSVNASGTNSASDIGAGMLTPRQRRAMLREALVCVSWHCSTHRLLPAEAQQLQELLLGQLLPALAPHLHTTNPKVLARAVFALGSCWASSWQQEDLGATSSAQQRQQQQYQGHDDDGGNEDENRNRRQQYTIQQQSLDSSTDATHQQPVVDQQHRKEQQQEQLQEGVVSQLKHTQRQRQHHRQRQQPPGLAVQMQQHYPGSSAEWVQHLLTLLPPSQLSAGALLATLQGCALHEVKPPPTWLAAASIAAYSMLESNRFDFNDAAALLQACAQLEYSPPSWLMRSLVWRLQQWIPFLNPADLAGVLSGLQVLGFRPGNTWLRVWCESSSRLLRGMNIGQLAAAAAALAWAGYSPKPWWGKRLCDATGLLLPVATADELLLLLDAVLALRLCPPLGWVHAVYCCLRAMKRSLSLSQVADAAHVLANLQLPASLYRHHRVWLAGCLKASQVQDVAGLYRSELLYLLYAAGKLKVNPGRAWLAAALQRLHGQLEGASPAELVGSFVVFCGFRSHLPLQRAQGEADVWLRDCLAAVVACVGQFSDEGLLQLLLACVDVGLGAQQQQVATSAQQQERQQQQQQDGSTAEDLLAYVQRLADTLAMRLPRMSLLQVSRVCKTLEGKVVSSSSSTATWFVSLVRKCKAASAAMA